MNLRSTLTFRKFPLLLIVLLACSTACQSTEEFEDIQNQQFQLENDTDVPGPDLHQVQLMEPQVGKIPNYPGRKYRNLGGTSTIYQNQASSSSF